MPCEQLYRSRTLEIASCVGDASHRAAVPMHWPSFEVHFQDDGAYFLHDGPETVLVDVHHVELRRAGSTQTYSRPAVTADRGTSIRFAPALLGGHASGAADLATDFPTGVVPLGWRRFRQLRALRRSLANPSDDGSEVEQQSRVLLASLVRTARRRDALVRSQRPTTMARRNQAVERAKALLVENCEGRPTLHEVASLVDYAPHHFARVFRDGTGMSVHEYLTQLRLRQAAARLDDGADNLSGLALDLGFSSQSHFTTAFRAWFGSTPGAYRGRAGSRGHSE